MAGNNTGKRIRDWRQGREITQAALAKAAGISAAYLNLIEHDKRQIGGSLLRKIAVHLDIDPADLTGTAHPRLVSDVLEIARTLAVPSVDENRAAQFVDRHPDWARIFIQLHRAYRDAEETAIALSDRLSQDPTIRDLSHTVLSRVTAIRSFAEILEQHSDIGDTDRQRFTSIITTQSDELAGSAREMITLLGGSLGEARPTSPAEEVDDFFIHHGNHFPVLEDATDNLRTDLERQPGSISTQIAERLAAANGIDKPHSPAIPQTTTRFAQARAYVTQELSTILEAAIDDKRLTTNEARKRASAALASYGAAALLFPYDRFLEAAERERYDIDRLCALFSGSFEQVAHRMVTLRRVGSEGVPFSFLRADPAGNLSKPFSVSGLRMPRYGGSCPLWAVHAAFATPERPVVQLAVMPEGERYLFIARNVKKRMAAYGEPPVTFSVMLACDAAYLDRIVYGDSFATSRQSLETPVGHSCRSCRRTNCAQRAHAQILPAAAQD
ncbi:MAG: short-chain fatty acyl-CoA regulator family protein [Pseudomonadota bacterium]